ncbi:MAG: DUF1080 domain-containing protein [Planctomycetia bacterium]|nr:DUF1080 domain-containing protein [Planctomycetia bacterium]
MRRVSLLLAIGVVAAAAGPVSAAESGDYLRLFNGRDFEGWVIDGPTEGITRPDGRPVWSVRDGEIVCAGNRWSFLRYERERFADFTLHVEFVMAPKGNSGVGLRTGPVDMTAVQTTRPSCFAYEIQLLDDAGQPPSPFSSGSLYRYVAPAENAMKPAGEWNTLEVTCRGTVIDVVLNGRPIQHFDQTTLEETATKPLAGHVCLQNHGHDVRFRNVAIRPLDGSATN